MVLTNILQNQWKDGEVVLLNENDIAGSSSSGGQTCCVLSASVSCDDALFAFSVDLNGSEDYCIHVQALRDSPDEEMGSSPLIAQAFAPLTRTSGQFVCGGKCLRSAHGGDPRKVCALQICCG